MNESKSGHLLWPNSYQKHKAFIETIMRLLTPAENIILDVACYKIGGWDEKRRSQADRIALSQFTTYTNLSRNTVRAALDELERANILLPEGAPTTDGQKYYLNLGERGDYELEYLATRERKRQGNPRPVEGLAAMNAVKSQIGLLPDMAVTPVHRMTPTRPYVDPVHTLTPSNSMVGGDHLNAPQASISMDTQKESISNDPEMDKIWNWILTDRCFDDPTLADYLREHITATEIDGNTLYITAAPALAVYLPSLIRVAGKLGYKLVVMPIPRVLETA